MRSLFSRASLCVVAAILSVPAAAGAQGISARQTMPQSGLERAVPVGVFTHVAPDGRLFAAVGPMILELESHSVRSPNFQLLEQGRNGQLVRVDPGPTRTYRGRVVGMPGAKVAGSVHGAELYARIITKSGEDYWVQPSEGMHPLRTMHVLYRGQDVVKAGLGCGTDLLPNARPARYSVGGGKSGSSPSPDAIMVAELACDADYEYYTDHGSSSVGVNNSIAAVINTMNLQYESQIEATHEIGTVIVRTSSSQPYTSTDAVTLLNQFRDQWNANHTNVQRDIAHFFTGKSINGGTIGIAWIGVVCNATYGYGLVESDFNNVFACATDLSAHELGHNWNAGHCGCRKNTMNASITCANSFHARRTVPTIVSFKNSLSCLSGGGGGNATNVLASVTTSTPGVGKGWRRGRAVVVVTDNLGSPVAGATVIGSFSGAIAEGPFNGTTDGGGSVTFNTTATLKGKFSLAFCVDDVQAALPWNQGQVCDNN